MSESLVTQSEFGAPGHGENVADSLFPVALTGMVATGFIMAGTVW